MKRVFLLLVVMTGLALATPKVGDSVTVRVLSAKVMKSPKFIGAAAGTASRGESFTVKEVNGDWYRVEGSSSGWLHKSNVADGKVELSTKPGGNGGNVNKDEVELAGRGFTPQVEDKYRQDHPDLDFKHVDAIEKTSVDPAKLEVFVRDGGLK